MDSAISAMSATPAIRGSVSGGGRPPAAPRAAPATAPPRPAAPVRPAVRAVVAVLTAVLALAVLPVLTAAAARAQDGSGIRKAAAALRDGPVYVDPRAADKLPDAQADALAERIEKGDKPVLVAVLPATDQFPADTLLRDLRTNVGIVGVYAVVRGDGFDAGADHTVMPPRAVSNLTGAMEREHGDDTKALLGGFVDQALEQADGRAPDTWSDGGAGGGGLGFLIAFGLLAVAGIGGVLLISRQSGRRRAERERAELDRVRPVVDEDITAFGEELRRVDFDPAAPGADDAQRQDYGRALDAYDRAKGAIASARRPDEVRGVSEALEEGRFALTVLEARRAGESLPERRPPCFFDPRHGVSVDDAPWTPEGGTERLVPVCAADRARLADGQEPMARTVDTPAGRRPYWEAGPAFGPWAGGYFGGGILPGLLVGTLLGSAMIGPYGYGGEPGEAGGPEGGDVTGSDFDPGGFGGGDGFGGGFDGGGFGGGGNGGGF